MTVFKPFPCPFKVLSENMRVVSRTKGRRSPLSGGARFTFNYGDHWAVDFGSYAMNAEFGQKIKALLASYDGRSTYFGIPATQNPDRLAQTTSEYAIFDDGTTFDDDTTFDDLVQTIISGTTAGVGSVAVETIPQSNVLIIENLGENAQLMIGDYICVGNVADDHFQTFTLTKDAVADAAGRLTLSVRPHIRWVIPVSTVVDFQNIMFKMRLGGDDMAGLETVFKFVPSAGLSFSEYGF